MADVEPPRSDPGCHYRASADFHHAKVIAARRIFNLYGNLRLAVFLATASACLFAFNKGYLAAGTGLALAGIAGFIALAVRHDRIKRNLDRETRLYEINRSGSARIAGAWKGFKDTGADFADERHPYSGDLDVFGHASLFQWICAAETRLGRIRLAGLLGNPPPVPGEVPRNQKVVRELSGRIGWRQDFQAAGMAVAQSNESPESLLAWAEAEHADFLSSGGARAVRVLGLLGPTLAFIAALVFRNPYLPLVPLLLLNGLAISAYQSRCKSIIQALCLQRRNLEAYRAMLRLIETSGFKGPHLLELTEPVTNSINPGSLGIKRLQSIADWLDVRQNPFVHVLLNLLFLWDLQWLSVFRRWSGKYGKSLAKWLGCIADLEAFASLSIIHFENPLWCFPSIGPEGAKRFRAVGLAHPLMTLKDGVANDFRLGDDGIVILTGSNMSGKSTMLRTVGINLVLAYAGAPVCASELESGRFWIMTSMRLKDDLDKGYSSFYAELLRIKTIVEASRGEDAILFLIDEIFRGTNSIDRIEGASEVLIGLAGSGAIGIVSTHDLELGRLESGHSGRFSNLHFAEHYEDGKIRFDYKLRSGLSTTRNAMHLLRMVGIRAQGP